MVVNWLPRRALDCARELATSTNTRTGAIAFSAPTNSVPKIEIHVACGTSSARIRPTARPITMRSTRLVLLY